MRCCCHLQAMEATAYGNESWLVADMFQQLMMSPAAAAAAPEGTASDGSGSSSSGSQNSSDYARYWEALLQCLQQDDSVDVPTFPALPEGHVHPVLWRLAAVALNKTIHIIDANDDQPKLMVYPPLEGMWGLMCLYIVHCRFISKLLLHNSKAAAAVHGQHGCWSCEV